MFKRLFNFVAFKTQMYLATNMLTSFLESYSPKPLTVSWLEYNSQPNPLLDLLNEKHVYKYDLVRDKLVVTLQSVAITRSMCHAATGN